MKVATIANTSIEIVEHNDERVLTTEQMAEVYGCESRNISDNFKNNEGHFEEGKHYFKLEGAELKAFKRYSENIGLPINKFASTLYLWTRRGASRHCKMLGTDKAWEMFDTLEENYFNPKPKALSPIEQMAQGLLAAQQIIADKDKLLEAQRPLVVFGNAVKASATSILIGALAKLLKQNGIDIGQKRLFQWLRDNGYLIKSGNDKNMPTQRSMEMGLFEIKEGSYIDSNDVNRITRTTKVTGKGQIYFINKFLTEAKKVKQLAAGEA